MHLKQGYSSRTQFCVCKDIGSTSPDVGFSYSTASAATITLIIEFPSSQQTTSYMSASMSIDSAAASKTNPPAPLLSVPTPSPAFHSSNSALRMPVIAGIIVGVIGSFIIVLLLCICYWRGRQRRERLDSSMKSQAYEKIASSGSAKKKKHNKWQPVRKQLVSSSYLPLESDLQEEAPIRPIDKYGIECPPLDNHPAIKSILNQSPEVQPVYPVPLNPVFQFQEYVVSQVNIPCPLVTVKYSTTMDSNTS